MKTIVSTNAFALIPMILLIAFYLSLFVFAVVMFIFRGWGLYSMAKNTEIKNPWLAWLPIAHEYLVGIMADRYMELYGKRTRYGFLSILLYCLSIGIGFLTIIIIYIMIFGVALLAISVPVSAEGSVLMIMGGGIAWFIQFYVSLLALSISAKVISVIAHYQFYRDFEPKRVVGYTLLTIFGLDAICKMLMRNNVPVGIAGEYPCGQPKYNPQSAGPGPRR